MMRPAKALSLFGLLAMTGVLVLAFTVGGFLSDGRQLVAMPWGIVSLVDLYVGLALFLVWIVFRERSLGRSLIWVVRMMVLGFFTASVYTFLALRSSGGDWHTLWFGRRA